MWMQKGLESIAGNIEVVLLSGWTEVESEALLVKKIS